MDKYEYRLKCDEIKNLIEREEYEKAANLADQIDWRRVKNVMLLCSISDVYKINKRYKEALDLLLYANDLRPNKKAICYSLCEMYTRMGNLVEALNYYKAYSKLTSNDAGKLILKYKMYEAQDVSFEERIEVLEALKHEDYREKWAYELAYLYHCIGNETKCIDECDELISCFWQADNKYVLKAMELKLQHTRLSADQQMRYEFLCNKSKENESKVGLDTDLDLSIDKLISMTDTDTAKMAPIIIPEKKEEENTSESVFSESDYEPIKNEEEEAEDTKEIEVCDEGIDNIAIEHVGINDYDTINLQAELAEKLKDVLDKEEDTKPKDNIGYEEISGQETRVFSFASENVKIKQQMVDLSQTTVLPLNTKDAVMERMREETVKAEPLEPESKKQVNFDEVLCEEPDGQISFVLPENEVIEKQITGQLNLDDFLEEWERMKKETEDKNAAEVRQQIAAQTGSIMVELVKAATLDPEEELKHDLLLAQEAERKAIEEGTFNPNAGFDDEDEDEPEKNEHVKEDPIKEELVKAIKKELDDPMIEEPADEELKETEQKVAISAVGEQKIEEIGEPSEESIAEDIPEPTREDNARMLTREERDLYKDYIQGKKASAQLARALDKISLISGRGNLIVTGDQSIDTFDFIKRLIKELRVLDRKFTGKPARVTGETFNTKNVTETLNMLVNGALIIQKAGDLDAAAANALSSYLSVSHSPIFIVLDDTRREIEKLMGKYPELSAFFGARIDLRAMKTEELVFFAKRYCKEMGYVMDEMGLLAFHRKLDESQTVDHAATIVDVQRILDLAMENVSKKSFRHLVDLLVGKRYDDDDMLVISEKDFE